MNTLNTHRRRPCCTVVNYRQARKTFLDTENFFRVSSLASLVNVIKKLTIKNMCTAKPNLYDKM